MSKVQRLRIVVEIDGKPVIDIDKQVEHFTIQMVNGTREVPTEATSWVVREPSGEHSFSLDYRVPASSPSLADPR
jgi:hypothetical protein